MIERRVVDVFFALLRAGLWENTSVHDEGFMVNDSSIIEWEEVMRLAEEQSVVGLVTAGIEQLEGRGNKEDGRGLVPKDILLAFVGNALQIEQQNKMMNQFIWKLIQNMRNAGIYTLLVKGQGVAQCYERPLWRTCGDVDLFLNEDNYSKAKDLLTPLASVVEGEYVEGKHLGMTIGNWVVELHGSLHVGLPKRINRVLDDIQRDTFYGGNVRSWDNKGVPVFMLGIENDIFYVFVHFLNHFYKGGIGLRQICDWCMLLWTYRESLNYVLLESRIQKAGLQTEWKAFGAFAVEYLGMPVDAVPLLDVRSLKEERRWKRKAERIRNFILMSGNFGHNRDMSFYSKYPYLIRKCCSMWMRVSDLINHARIFPLNTLKFFPSIMFNGLKGAVRGE